MFEIAKCNKCGAELWLHSIEGKLVINEGKILIDDGNHTVDLAEFVQSLGFRQKQKIRVSVEKV